MNNINDFEKAKKLFQQGLINLQDENYEDAEVKLLECLKLIPNRISTLHNLIAVYIATKQKNKLKEIINSHNHLINEHEIKYGYAFDQYFDQNYPKSIEICKELITLDNFNGSLFIIFIFGSIRDRRVFEFCIADSIELYVWKLFPK